MPRAPRTGSWANEYARRVERNRGLPREVVRGHGPLSVKQARQVEAMIAGKPRAMPVKTQEKYRDQIAEYEKKYRGGLVTGHEVRRDFKTEKAAREWVQTVKGIRLPSRYAEIARREIGGKVLWRVTLLR